MCLFLYLYLSEVLVIIHNCSDCVTCLPVSIYESFLVDTGRHRDLPDLWSGSHWSGADHISRQLREDAVSPVIRPVLRGLRDHLVVVGVLWDAVAGCVEDEEDDNEELEDQTVPGKSNIIVDDP